MFGNFYKFFAERFFFKIAAAHHLYLFRATLNIPIVLPCTHTHIPTLLFILNLYMFSTSSSSTFVFISFYRYHDVFKGAPTPMPQASQPPQGPGPSTPHPDTLT